MSNIKRCLRGLAAVFTLALSAPIMMPSVALAASPRPTDSGPRPQDATQKFVITDFNADYYPNNQDPQGRMKIVERIRVNFSAQNHGIQRALPQKYGKHDLQLHVNSVSSESGAPAGYTTSTANNNLVLRIGDPAKTVTGEQEYTIDYTVSNVITFHDNSVELYWDVNGNGWSQEVEHALAIVHLPSGLKINSKMDRPLECFAGEEGSTDRNCTIADDKQAIYAETIKPLAPYATLSMVIGFDPGYFHPETAAEKAQDNWKPAVALVVLPAVSLVFGLVQWLRKGRDPKGKGTIIAQYDAPDRLSPLEVGTLVDFQVQHSDISALLISLAVRKYLRIIESRTDHKLGKDTFSYELELLQSDFTSLNPDERLLLEALFPSPQAGQRKALDGKDGGSVLYKAADKIRKQAEARLTILGYFVTNPLQAGRRMLFMGIGFVVLAILGAHLVAPQFIVGAVIAAGISFIFWKIMPARTAKGVAAVEHLKGLKLYLKTAEADRIKMLQSPGTAGTPAADDPAAGATAAAPAQTVELFEKLLPYAMVLGVEQEWAKQFASLYTQPPDWYSGNFTAFNAGVLAGNLSDGFSGAVGSSFAAPSSSSSSGLGGGGFAGGGGGGGGGGGW